MYRYLFFLISFSAHGVISDGLMIQVASNTLSSVRELKEIVTSTREFSKEFERVHAAINTKIWQVQRAEMWMEDLRSLEQSSVSGLDDINYLLRSLKSSKQELESMLFEVNRKKRESEQEIKNAKTENKKAKKRGFQYRSESLGSYNSSSASIATAKNTHDLLVEQAKTNVHLSKIVEQLSKEVRQLQVKNEKKIAQRLKDREALNIKSRGILKQEDFQ